MNRLFLLLAALGVLPSFADGENSIINTEMAANVVNTMKTELISWVTTVLPYLLGIAGPFLVFWLVRLAIGLVKDFVNRSVGGPVDGYIYHDGMIFEDEGDLNDYLSTKDDPEFDKDYNDWLDSRN